MAQVLTKYDRYSSDFRDFERTLPEDGPEWASQIRRGALSAFTELGFPTATRGNEEWKYTHVSPLANATFVYPFGPSLNRVTAAHLRRLTPESRAWTRLVFVDGHYMESLSTPPANAGGVRVVNLQEAMVRDGELVEPHLARYAAVEEDGFTALNTAFVQEGAFVYMPAGLVLRQPLHLVYLTSERPQPAVSYPRTLVVLEDGSAATVVESYVTLSPARYFTDAVTEMVVGAGAALHHYRLLMESPAAFHIGITRVHQSRESTFNSTSFAWGSALARNDLHVFLDGPGSSCSLRGLYLTAGTQHMDNHISIDHMRPHTTSNQYFKGILAGRSRAVFSGRVRVHKDAQKSSASQTDKNLLLSEGAEVDTKPSLEIFADDVQCNHGATAGAIAEEALFYMRSRGLDQEEATRFLIQGFAREIVDGIPLRPLRTYLEQLTMRSLPIFQSGELQ